MAFTLDGRTLPTPQPDAINAEFWDAAKQGGFVVAKCDNCGNVMAAPVANCRNCLSMDISWMDASGRGEIFTFIEYHRAWRKEFSGILSYVVAVVTLAEGPRMVLGVLGDADAVRIGDPIEIVYQERAEGYRVPMAKIRPAGTAGTHRG
jgi:hypothetical protein